MVEKKRRRITTNVWLKPPEEERRRLTEEAFDRLSCVSEKQFMEWADKLWEVPSYPSSVEEVLFMFCGDCTNAYEKSQRRLGLCNRDEWDLVGSDTVLDIDLIRTDG